MARTVAPGTPTPINTVNVDIPDMDLSVFDRYGDAKIKSATQNFKLYATTKSNIETQKLYQQYKENPVALANALSKLPEMFSDLPQSVQDEMKAKLDENAISLVSKAQANQEKAIERQNKRMAFANSFLLDQQISEDVDNVLRNMVSTDEEKKPVLDQIYRAHRLQSVQLSGTTDKDGNWLFTESQREKLLNSKQAVLAGINKFINRMEKDQLKEWDEKYFQNREKFMNDLGITEDTYQSAETLVTKRMKALNDTKLRTLHGQAYYDAMNLITEPTKVNLEKAKSYDWMSGKASKGLDKLTETAQEITQAKYYRPDLQSSPTAFLQGLDVYKEILDSIPDDPTPLEQQKVVAAAAEANERLILLAKEINLEPKYADAITKSIKQAMVDKLSKQALVNAGFANRTQGQEWVDIAQGAFKDKYDPQKPLGAYQKQMYKQSDINRYKTEESQSLASAQKQYNEDLYGAMLVYLSGDMDGFRQACAEADRRFDMNRAGFIVKSDYEWQRLQNALANKQPALVNYMGRILEFKGFDNKGAVFVEKH